MASASAPAPEPLKITYGWNKVRFDPGNTRTMNFTTLSALYKPMRIYDSLSEKTQAKLLKAPVEIQRLMLNLVDDIRKESVSLDYLDDDDYEVPESPKSTAEDKTGADKEPDDEGGAVPKVGEQKQDAPTRVITTDDAKLAEKIQNDLAKGKIKLKDLSESDIELYKYLYPTQYEAHRQSEEYQEKIAQLQAELEAARKSKEDEIRENSAFDKNDITINVVTAVSGASRLKMRYKGKTFSSVSDAELGEAIERTKESMEQWAKKAFDLGIINSTQRDSVRRAISSRGKEAPTETSANIGPASGVRSRSSSMDSGAGASASASVSASSSSAPGATPGDRPPRHAKK